jgi:pyochelin synthetase
LLDRPVHAFQAPGVDGHGEVLDSIEALAATYVTLLNEQHPTGPVLLGGWSSGALIAFEMAVQLRRRGRAVAGVVMIDCPAPMNSAPLEEKVLLGWFLEDLALDLPVADLVAAVEFGDARRQLEQVAALLQQSGRPLELSLDQLTSIYRVFSGIVRGSRSHVGVKTDVDLLQIRARDGIVSEFAECPYAADPAWGWKAYTTGNVDAEKFAGTHYTLLSNSSVPALAKAVEGWLQSRER